MTEEIDWEEYMRYRENDDFDYVKRNIMAQHQANVTAWKISCLIEEHHVSKPQILVPYRWASIWMKYSGEDIMS